MDDGEQARIKKNNAYLNELEQMSINLNMLAPSLSALLKPKQG